LFLIKLYTSIFEFTMDEEFSIIIGWVKNWKSNCTVFVSCWNGHIIKDIKKGFSIVPRTNFWINLISNILILKPRNRYPFNMLLCIETTIISEERSHLIPYFCISILIPFNSIHFVNKDNKVLYAQWFNQVSMFWGLTAFLETGFEFSFSSRNNKCTNISLSSTLNHIRNIILMSWGIKYSKSLGLGLEKRLSNFHSLSFCSLFRIQIHYISNPPWFSLFCLSITLHLFQLHLVNCITWDKNSSTCCGLSWINMPNKNYIDGFSGCVHLHEFTGIKIELLIYNIIIGIRALNLFHDEGFEPAIWHYIFCICFQ